MALEVNQELQDLTNKFLEEFFETYAKTSNKSKRDDGFAFRYILPDALVQSQHFSQDVSNNDDYGVYLMSSSFSFRMAQNELDFNSNELFSKLLFLIDYWKDNDTDRSLIELVSDEMKQKQYEEFNWEKNDMSDFKIDKVMRDYRFVTFRLRNTTNFMDLKIEMEFHPKSNKLVEVRVSNAKGHFFTKTMKEAKITNYDSIKDVNGLYNALNNVIISIEEKLDLRYTDEYQTDMFEYYEYLPYNVIKILSKYSHQDGTYKSCAELEAELKPLGYTFDWELDAQPTNLRKIR